MTQKRVLIIANKWWECDPLCNVLLHDDARPQLEELRKPIERNHPRPHPIPKSDDKSPFNLEKVKPRLVYELAQLRFEVWCVSDLLEELPEGQPQSSSEEKANRLAQVFKDSSDVALVVAFGTAGYPAAESENGTVVCGTRVFVHDGHPKGDDNRFSRWRDQRFETVLPSELTEARFNAITTLETSPKPTVMYRFIVEPLNPAGYSRLLARHDFVALSEVNVSNYDEYKKKDEETKDAFAKVANVSSARSLETTHGVIRLSVEAPFLFVSGITDRVGFFADEVNPRAYAQNFVAAHNAGIVVAWMIPRIAAVLGS